jgi:hypothetical protein
VTKKPTKTKPLTLLEQARKQATKLRADNKALRKRVAELETVTREPAAGARTGRNDAAEVVTVQVGPLMPWETALPNSFEAKS